MSEVIEVSKTTVYVLLGTIALLEVVILLFQGQLFSLRKEVKELLKSRKSGQVQEHSLDVDKRSRQSSS